MVAMVRPAPMQLIPARMANLAATAARVVMVALAVMRLTVPTRHKEWAVMAAPVVREVTEQPERRAAREMMALMVAMLQREILMRATELRAKMVASAVLAAVAELVAAAARQARDPRMDRKALAVSAATQETAATAEMAVLAETAVMVTVLRFQAQLAGTRETVVSAAMAVMAEPPETQVPAGLMEMELVRLPQEIPGRRGHRAMAEPVVMVGMAAAARTVRTESMAPIPVQTVVPAAMAVVVEMRALAARAAVA